LRKGNVAVLTCDWEETSNKGETILWGQKERKIIVNHKEVTE
jgi:hypothetical protein